MTSYSRDDSSSPPSPFAAPQQGLLATVIAALQGSGSAGRDMVESLPEWPAQRYEHIRRIHVAIYGSVHLMWDVELEQKVCVKMLDAQLVFGAKDESLAESALSEMAVYALLRLQTSTGDAPTPHLAEMQGAFRCQRSGQFMLVTTFYEVGELFSLVNITKETPEAVFAASSQTLQAVAELHARGFAHRDVSLENLWVHSDSTVKLGDFGQVAPICDPALLLDPQSRRGNCEEWFAGEPKCWGKKDYVPPEIAQRAAYLPSKVDMYAAGVSIFAMATARFPWSAYVPHPTAQLPNFDIEAGLRAMVQEEKLERHLSPLLVDLLAKLLNPNPRFRPSAVEALAHPYFHTPTALAPTCAPTCATDAMEATSFSADNMACEDEDLPMAVATGTPPAPETVPIPQTFVEDEAC